MKVYWIHNYSGKNSSGVFMFEQFEQMEDNVTLVNVGNLYNPYNFLKQYLRLRKVIHHLDIVHAQYGSGTGFLTSYLPGEKIVTLRGSDWYKSPAKGLISKFHIWFGNLLTKLSLNRFDVLIVMSELMKKEVSLSYPDKRIEVLPSGIDLQKFRPEKKANEVSKKKQIVFSSIHDNNPVKRHDLALRVLDELRKDYKEITLLYLNNVPHKDVSALLNKADVILLTSIHEGWPNVIKEGLACNIPFVSTDVSDLKQIAEKTNLCHVCKDDPKELANSLKKVFNSKQTEDLRQFVMSMEISKTANRLYSIYQQIAK